MKKLIIIFLLTFGVNAFGATYYVSKGGDNTTGLSWATAWSDTTTAVDSVNKYMSGGDSCFFGAGTWLSNNADAVIPVPTGATPTDRTLYACSSFVEGLATISGAETVTDWVNHSGNIYKAHHIPIGTEILYNVAEDDSLMWRTTSLENVTKGYFYYNDATDTLYLWGYTEENPNSHRIYASNRIVIDMIIKNRHYTTIWGLKVKYGCKVGIRIGGTDTAPDSVYVEHCEVSHVSGQNQQNTSGISCRTGGTNINNYGRGIIIRGCYVHHIREEGSWYGHTKCICMYGTLYSVIDSCYTVGSSYGILYKGQSPSGTSMLGNVIRFNEVVAGGLGFTSFCQVDSAYGNIVRDYTGSSAWGLNLEGAGLDSSCRIFNNTVYNVTKPIVLAGLDGEGLDGDPSEYCSIKDHWFKYNIISYSGSEDAVIWGNIDATDTNAICFDSNYYYRGGGGITIRYLGAFANWQAAGFDIHSVVADPGFNENFEPTNIPAWDNPITYGGRTWYGPGAVQTLWGEEPPPPPPVNPNRRKRAILNTEQ